MKNAVEASPKESQESLTVTPENIKEARIKKHENHEDAETTGKQGTK